MFLNYYSSVLFVDKVINYSRSESYFLGEVVQDIRNKRIPLNLKISIYPIGYDACDEYLNLFLQVGSQDVLVVGICGESQMGKTVIAKALYDQIRHAFEGSSFLSNVGQRSRKSNGIRRLQEKLVHDILPSEKYNITSPVQGVDLIRLKLSGKRVLIVIDDVDDFGQLCALVGNRNWFGLGSKIIITTRKTCVLHDFGVDQIFMTRGNPVPLEIQVCYYHLVYILYISKETSS